MNETQRQVSRTWAGLAKSIDKTRKIVQDPNRYSPKPKKKLTRRQKFILFCTVLTVIIAGLCAVFVIPFRCEMCVTVTVSPTVTSGGSVGREWTAQTRINGESLPKSARAVVTSGRVLQVDSTVIEADDARQDVGESSRSVYVNAISLLTGFTVTDTVNVTENGGRYTGSEAAVQVTYRFAR